MKRIIPTMCLAFACAVTLGAQSTATGQQQPTDPYGSQKSSSDKSAKSVSLTGCLQEGDTPGSYVLANVDPSSLQGMGREHGTSASGTSGSSRPTDPSERPTDPEDQPPTGTSGSSSMSSSSGMGMKVQLNASGASVDLKQHVNQQVRVTGTLAPGSMSSSSATGTSGSTSSTSGSTGSATGSTSSSSSPGSMSRDKDMKKMTVSSISMVNSTCSSSR